MIITIEEQKKYNYLGRRYILLIKYFKYIKIRVNYTTPIFIFFNEFRGNKIRVYI